MLSEDRGQMIEVVTSFTCTVCIESDDSIPGHLSPAIGVRSASFLRVQ